MLSQEQYQPLQKKILLTRTETKLNQFKNHWPLLQPVQNHHDLPPGQPEKEWVLPKNKCPFSWAKTERVAVRTFHVGCLHFAWERIGHLQGKKLRTKKAFYPSELVQFHTKIAFAIWNENFYKTRNILHKLKQIEDQNVFQKFGAISYQTLLFICIQEKRQLKTFCFWPF